MKKKNSTLPPKKKEKKKKRLNFTSNYLEIFKNKTNDVTIEIFISLLSNSLSFFHSLFAVTSIAVIAILYRRARGFTGVPESAGTPRRFSHRSSYAFRIVCPRTWLNRRTMTPWPLVTPRLSHALVYRYFDNTLSQLIRD